MSDTPAKTRTRVVDYLLIFVAAYLLVQMGMKYFFPQNESVQTPHITLKAQQASLRTGHYPQLQLQNKTAADITLPARCPQPPVDVYVMEQSGQIKGPLTASGTAVPCGPALTVAPGETGNINLAPWKYAFFDEPGTYEMRLPSSVKAGSGSVTSAQVSMHTPGIFVQVFRAFITKPLLNLLVFISSLTPSHNLGVAIVVLTILIKLLLFIPTQHALEGQRKMQLLQPKMEELKQRYKGDAQKINTETMKLWKDNKINPFQSCLPILLQFPVLIGLFYVIRDGSVLPLSKEFLYTAYQGVDFHFGTMFLGFDLTVPSKIIAPVTLVLLQFFQMKLSFSIAKKKKGSDQKADPATEMQQRIMVYALPLMIGFFAFQFPMAVSLYWAISTLFAIGQQLVVNRKVLVA